MKRPILKRLLAGLGLVTITALLSGCYIQPDYGYVRGNGYAGDAYYGSGPAVIYNDGYYASPYYYGGYGYGCCWAPGVDVTIGGVWYGGRYYRHGYRRWDHDGGGRGWGGGSWRGNAGHWQGRGSSTGHSSSGHSSGRHWDSGHFGH